MTDMEREDLIPKYLLIRRADIHNRRDLYLMLFLIQIHPPSAESFTVGLKSQCLSVFLSAVVAIFIYS